LYEKNSTETQYEEVRNQDVFALVLAMGHSWVVEQIDGLNILDM
jgi:hypothetical protein